MYVPYYIGMVIWLDVFLLSWTALDLTLGFRKKRFGPKEKSHFGFLLMCVVQQLK